MLSTISLMIDEFEKNKINYCHWKSNEHLEPALNGDTDLDILFDISQRQQLEIILAKCGLKRFRATPLMQYNAIEDYIGFDKETAKIWHLHTHYRMTLGESHLKGYTITPWSNIILKNRIKGEKLVYTSSYEDELVLLLCRIALKIRWRDISRKIGKDDIKEINWLKKKINQEKFKEEATIFTSKKTAKILIELTKTKIEKKSQFLKLQRELRILLKPFTSYTKATSYFTRTKREFFWIFGGLKRRMGLNSFNPNRRLSPAGGTVAAILGCDGAGKSTTINYIKKEFSKKIDVVTIYFGSGDGSSSLVRKPMKIIAKKVAGKGVGHKVEKEYQTRKRISLKSRIYSLAKIIWAVTLANEKKKKLKQMTKARNNGLLVITDRYPQSTNPGCSDGPLLHRYYNNKGLLGIVSRWEQKVYETASVNPPDITIKLMVPTEIAIKRKPEMTENEINTKKDIVANMNISEHSAIIDTSRNFDITIGEVMDSIWKII